VRRDLWLTFILLTKYFFVKENLLKNNTRFFLSSKNRGFGFLTRKSDGADFFVHSRSIRNADLEFLHEGMEVEFCEVQNNRGAEAKDVRIIKNTNSMENTR
jgi:CspA family cold shock protein